MKTLFRNKTFIIFLLLNNCVTVFSQNYSGKDNEKYWYYRNRLKFFMTGVGNSPGQSLPMTDRLGNDNYLNSNKVVCDDAPATSVVS
jgi:hypothetical protein